MGLSEFPWEIKGDSDSTTRAMAVISPAAQPGIESKRHATAETVLVSPEQQADGLLVAVGGLAQQAVSIGRVAAHGGVLGGMRST